MCAFSNNLPHFATKRPQKRSKLPQNHKTVPHLANKVDFPTFWHELIILRGNNIGRICTWQPLPNSAPIRRRLVEKLLQTVLFHQNDYQWPKNRKVAYLYFRCNHFEGHGYHILRTAEKKSTRSAINTLVGRELRLGGYPPRRSRITTAPAGEIEQERITESYGPLLFGVCIPYGTSATIVQHCTIHTDGFVSTKNPRKTSFTLASLGFCAASPTETKPSHCFFLQTMHRGAPIPSNGFNLRF